MSKRRWTIDVALIIIVVALGVLVYLRLERLFKSWRDNDGTPASVETTDIEGDFSPTLQARVDIAKQEEVPALDFTLQNLEGKIVALSDHEGTAVLVNFWATWCPPCRAEMPLIQAFADRHEDDLVVLAVNVGESETVVRQFIDEHGFKLTFLLDPSNSIAELYQVRGFPTSLFIDPDGILQATHIGELDEALITAYFQEIGVRK